MQQIDYFGQIFKKSNIFYKIVEPDEVEELDGLSVDYFPDSSEFPMKVWEMIVNNQILLLPVLMLEKIILCFRKYDVEEYYKLCLETYLLAAIENTIKPTKEIINESIYKDMHTIDSTYHDLLFVLLGFNYKLNYSKLFLAAYEFKHLDIIDELRNKSIYPNRYMRDIIKLATKTRKFETIKYIYENDSYLKSMIDNKSHYYVSELICLFGNLQKKINKYGSSDMKIWINSVLS